MQEILDETIEWYSVPGRRSVDVMGDCMYLNEDGNMCAFGRCAIDPKILKERSAAGIMMPTDTDFGLVGNGIRIQNEDKIIQEVYIDTVLKEQYRGHHGAFWKRLQQLHDFVSYWRDGGLTETGQEFVNKKIKPIIEEDALLNTRESV